MSQYTQYLAISVAICICGVVYGNVKSQGYKEKILKMCPVKLVSVEHDCMKYAQPQDDGQGVIPGGWMPEDMNAMDSSMTDIKEDVKMILKSCGLENDPEFLGIYKQVVNGLNICISADITSPKCSKNDVGPCESKTRRCSIKAYKPFGKAPIDAKDVSIYCQ